MTAWYNENDRHAAAWLRELIKAEQIAEGTVDERSIAELTGAACVATRCHFFAGIGGWDYALRLAGWPADRPVWTGSCPCQPFSQAGRRRGVADERHLWPVWRELIRECRPPTIFGEQVASKAGRAWLAGVRADLEEMGYAVGAADLCAAGIGAPHIRQRLYWVADAVREQLRTGPGADDEAPSGVQGEARQRERIWPESGDAGGLADGVAESEIVRHQQRIVGGEAGAERSTFSGEAQSDERRGRDDASDGGDSDRLGDAAHAETPRLRQLNEQLHRQASVWSRSELVWCRDGFWRRTQPGIRPLAHGVSGRVGMLRGFGNAIVPQVAAEFVKAYMEARAALKEEGSV